MNRKLPVAVLGATGVVGQRLVRRLACHPWFELTTLAASERSAGKRYADACAWRLPGEPYAGFADRPVVACDAARIDEPLVISALDATIAREVEPALARRGALVCSNASAFRMSADVPLLVPEVNADHVDLVLAQRASGSRGAIVCNPNCTTTVLVLALKPLADAFGIDAVSMTSLQALSGAGWPGVSSLDATANVVPFIGGEEEKVEEEATKILGAFTSAPRPAIQMAPFVVSAQCTRVPVVDGHTEAIGVKLRGAPSQDAVVAALRAFRSPFLDLELPSMPATLVRVHDANDRPQPRLDVERDDGMSVHVGRVRRCSLLGIKFIALGHNAERGAAGGALLNAELLVRKGIVS